MQKILILQLTFLLLNGSVCAQNVEPFDIPSPTTKVSNSLYNKFSFLDSRPDTTNLGGVQTGFFNRKAKVIANVPLSVQLKGVFNALTDTSAKQSELLLQLRQFNFAELTAGMSEKGYCYFRAALYVNRSGQYQQVRSIDTVIILKSSIDVTQGLLKAGKETISAFIADNLTREPSGAIYSYHDISNIDSIEKKKIKLYNTATYTDGLYLNYKSLMDQAPDKQITVDGNDLNLSTIKTTVENGKQQKVKANKVYAIVYKGQPYVASRGVYYPLRKENDDFFFTGRAQVNASTGDVVAASIMFGAVGGALASNADALFEMKIDHVNGIFIRLREIPEPPNPAFQD